MTASLHTYCCEQVWAGKARFSWRSGSADVARDPDGMIVIVKPPVEPVGPPGCCRAMTAECLSCVEGMGEDEYCAKNPQTIGCHKTRR